MTSLIDMSLEDIIQKRRKENKRSKIKPQNPNIKSQPKSPTQKRPIVDARNKIISKKRTQIKDAREKLAELAKHKDARLKLELMRKQRVYQNANLQFKGRTTFNRNHLPFMRTVQNKERVFIDSSRQVHSQPLSRAKMAINRQLTTKRNIESRSIENRSMGLKTSKFSVNLSNRKSTKNTGITRSAPLKPIVRTVENDLEMYDEPMDSDLEMEPPRVSLNRKASLQLKITARTNEPRESRSSVAHRSAPIERDVSPPRPPSILKKRPMAALMTDKKVEKPSDKPHTEYRIIVSSLGSTVTAGDIEELFGDVGGMIESRLVRPGTAEVIYKTLEDAQRAVDLYHKRQLDGQPMNCLLVTPRSNAAPQRSGNKPGLYSTNSNVEPDLSTFHKVLFSNF